MIAEVVTSTTHSFTRGFCSIAVNVGMRVVGVSPIIPPRAFFLLWLKEPISLELVKEEHPLINRVIAKKSTASFQHLHCSCGYSGVFVYKSALLRATRLVWTLRRLSYW